MLQNILKTAFSEKSLDATDALAVAVCHHFQSARQSPVGAKSYNGWGDFLKNNPGKLKK